MKYYTPEKEEFHVGFEFEVLMYYKNDPVWKDRTFCNTDSIQSIEMSHSKDQLRVKHLDREDIESLGWKLKYTHSNGNVAFTKETTLRSRSVNEYTDIILNSTNSWIVVSQGDDEAGYSEWVTRFSGTINNKSELKRTLKQLGI